MNTKVRLIVMNFLEFAVWGAYLTSMGGYLAKVGLAENIGWFYSVQGFVSLFMPALIGIVADRFVPAQKMLGISHLLAGAFMAMAGYMGMTHGDSVSFAQIFPFYALSVAFFMPTLGLSNSVSYSALDQAGLDAVKAFPPIRVFGTIGFIVSMWIVDLMGFQHGYEQFFVSALWSVVLGAYAFTLPPCAVNKGKKSESMVDALGLRAFALFKERKMAIFFVFSMMLGMSLQITNAFADGYIKNFGNVEVYGDKYLGTFGVEHSTILISLSQISETLCILLIPFCLKKFGIKNVMLISMFAWVLRFGLLGAGNPGAGVWMFILSMIVYGVAFDFFNISGSLYVEKETAPEIRASAQGVFMIMTNGFGAFIGSYVAGWVVDKWGWPLSWYIFAGYALVVAILFALVFRYKHNPNEGVEVKH